MRLTVTALLAACLAGCGSNAAAPPPVEAPIAAPPVSPPAAATAPQDDLRQPGTYRAGPWTYTLTITAKGSKSEGTQGELQYNGQAVPPAVVTQFYETPWGDLVYAGEPELPWQARGWYLREGTRPEGAQPLTPP